MENFLLFTEAFLLVTLIICLFSGASFLFIPLVIIFYIIGFYMKRKGMLDVKK